MNNEFEKTVQSLMDSVEETMENLFTRWQDEKEYEDFEDYKQVMRQIVSRTSGVNFIDASSEPFGFDFSIGNITCCYTIRPKDDENIEIECSLGKITPGKTDESIDS